MGNGPTNGESMGGTSGKMSALDLLEPHSQAMPNALRDLLGSGDYPGSYSHRDPDNCSTVHASLLPSAAGSLLPSAVGTPQNGPSPQRSPQQSPRMAFKRLLDGSADRDRLQLRGHVMSPSIDGLQTASELRHAHIHTYIHTCMHACMHTCLIHTYIHTYIHACTHTYIHTYMCVRSAKSENMCYLLLHICAYALPSTP